MEYETATVDVASLKIPERQSSEETGGRAVAVQVAHSN
jgi:hypothetical protein